MIEFKPFEPWHIPLIEPQDAQINEKIFNANVTDELVVQSFGLSAWDGGTCLGAAGIRPIWNGRAVAWALVGRQAGPFMLPIVRKVRFFLATWPANRIEMTVRAEFGPGCRLAALLGFKREARLLGFFPDGSTAYLFTRLKHV